MLHLKKVYAHFPKVKLMGAVGMKKCLKTWGTKTGLIGSSLESLEVEGDTQNSLRPYGSDW